MKRMLTVALGCGIFAVAMVAALAQPGDEKEKKGPPGGKKGPPPYELGRVLPGFLRDQLDLTADQEKQIADLEKDVKAKLMRILTDDQKRKIEQFKGKGPGGKDDKGPKDKGFKGPKGDKGDKEPKDDKKPRDDKGLQASRAIAPQLVGALRRSSLGAV